MWHAALGRQTSYNSAGYTLLLLWEPEYNAHWDSLGCLQSLTNLALHGALPNLRVAWAQNGSFPRLEVPALQHVLALVQHMQSLYCSWSGNSKTCMYATCY